MKKKFKGLFNKLNKEFNTYKIRGLKDSLHNTCEIHKSKFECGMHKLEQADKFFEKNPEDALRTVFRLQHDTWDNSDEIDMKRYATLRHTALSKTEMKEAADVQKELNKLLLECYRFFEDHVGSE